MVFKYITELPYQNGAKRNLLSIICFLALWTIAPGCGHVVHPAISCVVAKCSRIEAQKWSVPASQELRSIRNCLFMRGSSPENFTSNNSVHALFTQYLLVSMSFSP